jgi:peptidoglycan/xylan/chitin deacetylase (PgdA/CDA1 family)
MYEAERADPSPRWILRRAAKAAFAGAVRAVGGDRFVRAVRRRQARGARVLLLSYHRATLDFEGGAREGLPSLLVSAETLRRQLEAVARSWEVVPLSDAVRVLAEPARGPERDLVAVGFDDGYADNHAVALPVLSALHVPATFYVATGYTGTAARMPHDRLYATLRELERRGVPPERAGLEDQAQAVLSACAGADPAATVDRLIGRLPHPRLLALAEALEARTGMSTGDLPPGSRLLDWDEVRELAASGMEIGGHSVNHAVLTNLPLAEARREIAGCSSAIAERLGRAPLHFAYPNGYHSPAVRQAVKEAGFESAATTEDRENVHGGDPFLLRRKVLWEKTTHGPLGFSTALAACTFDGVFQALRLARAVPGERPDGPDDGPRAREGEGSEEPAPERAAS